MNAPQTKAQLFTVSRPDREIVIEPHSAEAERSLLGAILCDNNLYDSITGIVTAEDFYIDRHRCVFRHLSEILVAQKPADLLTVSNSIEEHGDTEVTGGRDFLVELSGNIVSEEIPNVTGHAEIIKNYACRRKLIAASKRILELALSGTESIDTLLANAERDISAITSGAVDDNHGTVTAEQAADALMEAIQRASAGVGGIKTGLSDIDRLIESLDAGELAVIAGRPSMGKTLLALIIAFNVAMSGRRVLFFSLEMSEKQLVARMLSILTKGLISPNIFKKAVPDHLAEIFLDAVERHNLLPINYNDKIKTPSQMLAAVRNDIAKGKKPDLIIVDHLHLIPPDRKNSQNKNDEIAEISGGMKKIAKTFDVPVILLSQLSRKVEERVDKRPVMRDLRDSGAIEQDADCIIFIYRDFYYEPTKIEKKNCVEIIVGKNRSGVLGTAEVWFDGASSTMCDIPLDPLDVSAPVLQSTRVALPATATTAHAVKVEAPKKPVPEGRTSNMRYKVSECEEVAAFNAKIKANLAAGRHTSAQDAGSPF